MLKFKTSTILLSLVIIYSCNGLSKEKREKKDSNRFYSSLYSFSIEKPKNWEIHKDFNNGIVVLFAKKDTFPESTFTFSIAVAIDYYSKKINLKKHYEGNLLTMQCQINKFKIVSETEGRANELKYKKLIYTHTFNDIDFKNIMYSYYFKNKGYSITCTSSTELFDAMHSEFEKIATSLKRY